MIDGIFDYLPADEIIAAFERSPGNELGSGKFTNPESSAALAANTFGYYLDIALFLPPLPETEHCGWPAINVSIEECVRFPWSGGRHPWLDAFVETQSHIIGIESKRYEPFRGKQTGTFSEAYWRPVWGKHMGQYEKVRDNIANNAISFERLDAVQLIKHAFGLRTEAVKRNKSAHLVYLYAEPEKWPDGRAVKSESITVHAAEVSEFSQLVDGAEVGFSSCTYKSLLAEWKKVSDTGVKDHANMVESAFSP